MAIYEEKYKVSVSHIGMSNQITNKGILSLLETIACSHSDMVGYGITDMHATHLSWVLLNWKVKILKRVSYSNIVTIKTWSKPGNKFQTYRDFEMLDEDGNIVCIATTKWALVSTEKGSLVSITDDIIGRYEPEEKNVFDNPDIPKLSQLENYSKEFTYTVLRNDIDVNQHMHNLNYLYLAYETLPEDVYNSPECNNMEIMYKKGIKLGETVKCLYSYSDSAHIVTIKSNDESQLHAIVKLY